MFDLSKTLELLLGALTKPAATWESWLAENPGWQTTTVRLAGPLVLAYAVLGVLFSRLMGNPFMMGGMNVVSAIVFTLFTTVVMLAIVTFAASFLAGMMGGQRDHQRAYAAVAVVSVPGFAGSVAGALIPGLGWLLGLAGGVVTLVFLYRILPQALDLPEGERIKHFVVLLLAVFIINALLMAALLPRSAFSPAGFSAADFGSGAAPLNEFERQGRLIEAAESDRYEPPSSGKVSETQVERLVAVQEKTARLVAERGQELEKRTKALENKEQPTFSDAQAVFGGIGSLVGLHNAEMEVVKTGGGNWAEHQWVKEQLRIAKIQQDGSDAIVHNYALYRRYAPELEGL